MVFTKKGEKNFFDKPIPAEVRDPDINNLSETVDFVKEYLDKHPNCHITIVGDYDADGICATTILIWTFRKIGIEPTSRLPRRISEGYGLSEKIIDEILEKKNSDELIITVDNGIAAADAIKKGKEAGFTIVVIDHHLPPKDEDGNLLLPPADIILDPHVNPELSEFEDYCGAGLAYRFARTYFPDLKLKPLLALASIATVTDVVPLVDANHTLVKDGLECINKRQVVPGLKALLDRLCMDDHITEEDYGFKIGPILNASGRLIDNGAEQVLRLFTAKQDEPRINIWATKLVEINEERKELVRKSKAETDKIHDDSRPVVLFIPNLHEGIIGILAGQYAEQYNCPAIVLTQTEDYSQLKGSGRSIPGIHLKSVLDSIQDTLVGYGGHAGAVGLTIDIDRFDEFSNAFKEAVGELPEIEHGVIEYDDELDVLNLENMSEAVNQYAPFGEKNPKPLFHLTMTPNGEYRVVGDGTHFMFHDDKITLMGFGLVGEYEKLGSPTKNIEMVGYLLEDWFKGTKSFKFEIVAMKSA